MYRKSLQVVVAGSALALAAGASAQLTDPFFSFVQKAGTGNVMLFPYYTTDSGNETYINVVNTTNETKAYKVRFREAKGSEDSLDFHLYLSPKDVWAAAMTQDASGTPTVVTADSSCTYGMVGSNAEASGANVKTTYLDEIESKLAEGEFDGDQSDVRGDPADRIREGYIEIIEMAVLPDDDPDDLGFYAVHENGSPRDCGVYARLNTEADELYPDNYDTGVTIEGTYFGDSDEPQTGEIDINPGQFAAPTGGSFANAAIIDVDEASYLPYEVTVLADLYTGRVGVSGPGGLGPIFFSQSDTRDDGGNLNGHTADRGLKYVKNNLVNGTGTNGLQYWDLPDLSTVNDASSGEAQEHIADVSRSLMTTSLYNEYVVDQAIGAETDWVVTLPTKRFHTNSRFETSGGEVTGVSQEPVREPFDAPFNYRTASSEEEAVAVIYDREELEYAPEEEPSGGFSPGVPAEPDRLLLKWEANVFNIAGNDGSDPLAISPVLGAQQTLGTIPVGGQASAGWINLRLDIDEAGDDSGEGGEGGEAGAFRESRFGLPAIGFAAIKFRNDALGDEGLDKRYGGTFRHRVEPTTFFGRFIE